MNRRCKLGLCPFVFLFFFSASVFSQGKPEKERIRIGYAARAVAHSIPYIAMQAGFFRGRWYPVPKSGPQKSSGERSSGYSVRGMPTNSMLALP